MPGIGELVIIAVAFFLMTQLRGRAAGERFVSQHASWTARTIARRWLPSWVPLPHVTAPNTQRELREALKDGLMSPPNPAPDDEADGQGETDGRSRQR